MPAVIYPFFDKLLFQLFTGAASPPKTLYIGLSFGGGSEVGTTDGQSPPSMSGYSRLAVPVSALTLSSSGTTLTIPPQVWTFTATPSQPKADTWFAADAETGSNFYFSGPLNPAPVTGTLSAAVAAYGSGLTIPTSVAAQLSVGDTLKLGSSCANNLEYVVVSAIGADSGGSTTLTAFVGRAHPSGEAFSRDGSARTYSAGWIETLNASLSIQTQPG